MTIIDIINEEVKRLCEAYDDIGIDFAKTKLKKLDTYNNYKDKKVINGITYLHFKEADDWHLWGNITAFDNADGTEVANASYGKVRENDRMVGTIDVRPDMRRKGIASNIYQWVEELTGEKLYPDIPHSDSAAKLWGNSNRKFGYDKKN